MWLLMTASPTRLSHLFILAASPPLCSVFGEGGNSSYFFASVQATLSTEEPLSPELQRLLYMADIVRAGLKGRNSSTRDSDFPGLFTFTPFRNCMPMANPPGCPASCQRYTLSADSAPASQAQEVVTRVPQPWGVSLLHSLS